MWEYAKKAGVWLWKRLFPTKDKASDQSQALNAGGDINIHDSQLTVQKTEDHSTKVTTGAFHLHQGLKYSEVESIAITIWKANFPQLQQAAMDEAQRRIQEFLKNLEPKLSHELNSHQLDRFRTPEIQYSFNQVLQAAALREEPELQQILAELIVGRVREESTSAQSIIYAEAIKTLPALTSDMVNILALHHSIRSIRLRDFRDWSDLRLMFETAIKPLLSFSTSRLEMQHLVYAGCGAFQGTLFRADFLHFFKYRYAKFFQIPVTSRAPDGEDLLGAAKKLNLELFDTKDAVELKFRFESSHQFETYLNTKVEDVNERPKFRGWFERAFLKPEAARSLLLQNVPEFELLFSKWPKESPLSYFQLTSVGRAIGESRLNSLSGGKFEWVNDESH